MKAIILAGGRGTRLGEISSMKPKPMVEIGNKPIIWHIMKLYSFYGVKDFIQSIKNQGMHQSNFISKQELPFIYIYIYREHFLQFRPI